MQKTGTKYSIYRWLLSTRAVLAIMFVLVTLVLTSSRALGQVASENLRAIKIVTCAEMAEWKSFKSPTEFTIGVYGQFAEELNPLKEFTKNRMISDRPIKVVHFRRRRDIVPTDVLFVNSRFNEELDEIYTTATNNKTLLIADHAPGKEHFMINLLLDSKGKDFEVNYDNAKQCDAIIGDKLVQQGGSTMNIRDQIRIQEEELKAKAAALGAKKDSIDALRKLSEEKARENNEIQQSNKALDAELAASMERLTQQSLAAAAQLSQVNELLAIAAKDRRTLIQQDRDLDSAEKLIRDANAEYKLKSDELTKREQDIAERTKQIQTGEDQIKQGYRIIIGLVIFLVAVLFLIIMIVKSLRERKRANLKLLQKNQELVAQTNEINKQTEELENVNKELEKLSIVAGKTQNAIVIMDRNGYFEWVNAGFTRFFGYTLQLLRNERDENIVNVSANKSIRNILYKCVSNKQTIVFESDATTRSGKKIAAQTTLSPILNNKGDVTQLVAIYSDITKLKEQEAAIRSQNEELVQQKNTLEIQKNQIEEQTKSIKAGIYYAQTIQQTILPPNEQIDRLFDSFILFRPKDIVSGDFYWYSEAQDGNKNYQFIGDFDCTGHGVPGAFMSLIGNRILNEVINVRKTYSPRDIMDELNINVIKALKQDQSTNNDGMDTCLTRVEKLSLNEYKVTFCGAKRPLYYLTTTSEEVMELKGDRKSIGGTQKKRGNIQFTDQELILHSGDMMVLCSDGISDQCDKDRKKFSSDRLRSLILQNRNEDMKIQGELLSKALDDYRGEEEQRDDISVIGIKFR